MKRFASLSLALPLCAACDPQEAPDYAGDPQVTIRGAVTSTQAPPSQAEAAVLWLTGDGGDCRGPTLECGIGYGGPDGTDFSCVEACGEPVCDPDALDAWRSCAEACEGVTVDIATATFEGCATGGVGERVSISVQEFPSDFEMALYDLPPEEALLRGVDDGPRVAMGIITALSADAPTLFDFEGEPSVLETILGGVTTHFVIYAADPVSADSAWGQYLGGSFDVGYHLVRYDADVDCEELEGECVINEESRYPEPLGFDADLELVLGPLEEIVLPS